MITLILALIIFLIISSAVRATFWGFKAIISIIFVSLFVAFILVKMVFFSVKWIIIIGIIVYSIKKIKDIIS